jgi:hypothetical protein
VAKRLGKSWGSGRFISVITSASKEFDYIIVGAGSAGSACTLVTSEDARAAVELVRVLKGSEQPVPLELERLAASAPFRRK